MIHRHERSHIDQPVPGKEIAFLFKKLSESQCAKRPVAAGTYVNGQFFWAVNSCHRVLTNGRISCARTVYYPHDEDCKDALRLCDSQHAETNLANIITGMWDEGADGVYTGPESDGKAWIVGHYYGCRNCAKALRLVGVKETVLRELE